MLYTFSEYFGTGNEEVDFDFLVSRVTASYTKLQQKTSRLKTVRISNIHIFQKSWQIMAKKIHSENQGILPALDFLGI